MKRRGDSETPSDTGLKIGDLFQGAIAPLREYVAEGLISSREHPELPYCILNYTDKCQYAGHWDLVTRQCRGLIFNYVTGEVLARPFEKFFNLGEPAAPPVEDDTWGAVSEKMDGSLGILYPTKDSYAIASRGSFVSEQAIRGTAILLWYLDLGWKPEPGLTHLFEIVYPENRIVLNYGNAEDLYLIDTLRNDTGFSYFAQDWPGPQVPERGAMQLREAANLPAQENSEGIVWRQLGSTLRVKMKQEDYVRLHRIVFGTNSRSVWEVLAAGKPDGWNEFMRDLPEEFHAWAERVAKGLADQKKSLEEAAYETYNSITSYFSNNYTRKDFAILAKQCENPGLVFKILDGKSIDEDCWKMVYPAHDWVPNESTA